MKRLCWSLAVLLVASLSLSLPACDSGPVSNVCDEAGPEGGVVITSFESCELDDGVWQGEGRCYCPPPGKG